MDAQCGVYGGMGLDVEKMGRSMKVQGSALTQVFGFARSISHANKVMQCAATGTSAYIVGIWTRGGIQFRVNSGLGRQQNPDSIFARQLPNQCCQNVRKNNEFPSAKNICRQQGV